MKNKKSPVGTGQKQVDGRAATQFKPGQSGNPKGRAKGSRNEFAHAFMVDLQTAWAEHGMEVIKATIETKPADFLRVAASILPKEMDLNINKYDNFTDDQLRQQFASALSECVALGLDLSPGVDAGADEEEERESPRATVSGRGTA